MVDHGLKVSQDAQDVELSNRQRADDCFMAVLQQFVAAVKTCTGARDDSTQAALQPIIDTCVRVFSCTAFNRDVPSAACNPALSHAIHTIRCFQKSCITVAKQHRTSQRSAEAETEVQHSDCAGILVPIVEFATTCIQLCQYDGSRQQLEAFRDLYHAAMRFQDDPENGSSGTTASGAAAFQPPSVTTQAVKQALTSYDRVLREAESQFEAEPGKALWSEGSEGEKESYTDMTCSSDTHSDDRCLDDRNGELESSSQAVTTNDGKQSACAPLTRACDVAHVESGPVQLDRVQRVSSRARRPTIMDDALKAVRRWRQTTHPVHQVWVLCVLTLMLPTVLLLGIILLPAIAAASVMSILAFYCFNIPSVTEPSHSSDVDDLVPTSPSPSRTTALGKLSCCNLSPKFSTCSLSSKLQGLYWDPLLPLPGTQSYRILSHALLSPTHLSTSDVSDMQDLLSQPSDSSTPHDDDMWLPMVGDRTLPIARSLDSSESSPVKQPSDLYEQWQMSELLGGSRAACTCVEQQQEYSSLPANPETTCDVTCRGGEQHQQLSTSLPVIPEICSPTGVSFLTCNCTAQQQEASSSLPASPEPPCDAQGEYLACSSAEQQRVSCTSLSAIPEASCDVSDVHLECSNAEQQQEPTSVCAIPGTTCDMPDMPLMCRSAQPQQGSPYGMPAIPTSTCAAGNVPVTCSIAEQQQQCPCNMSSIPSAACNAGSAPLIYSCDGQQQEISRDMSAILAAAGDASGVPLETTSSECDLQSSSCVAENSRTPLQACDTATETAVQYLPLENVQLCDVSCPAGDDTVVHGAPALQRTHCCPDAAVADAVGHGLQGCAPLNAVDIAVHCSADCQGLLNTAVQTDSPPVVLNKCRLLEASHECVDVDSEQMPELTDSQGRECALAPTQLRLNETVSEDEEDEDWNTSRMSSDDLPDWMKDFMRAAEPAPGGNVDASEAAPLLPTHVSKVEGDAEKELASKPSGCGQGPAAAPSPCTTPSAPRRNAALHREVVEAYDELELWHMDVRDLLLERKKLLWEIRRQREEIESEAFFHAQLMKDADREETRHGEAMREYRQKVALLVEHLLRKRQQADVPVCSEQEFMVQAVAGQQLQLLPDHSEHSAAASHSQLQGVTADSSVVDLCCDGSIACVAASEEGQQSSTSQEHERADRPFWRQAEGTSNTWSVESAATASVVSTPHSLLAVDEKVDDPAAAYEVASHTIHCNYVTGMSAYAFLHEQLDETEERLSSMQPSETLLEELQCAINSAQQYVTRLRAANCPLSAERNMLEGKVKRWQEEGHPSQQSHKKLQDLIWLHSAVEFAAQRELERLTFAAGTFVKVKKSSFVRRWSMRGRGRLADFRKRGATKGQDHGGCPLPKYPAPKCQDADQDNRQSVEKLLGSGSVAATQSAYVDGVMLQVTACWLW